MVVPLKPIAEPVTWLQQCRSAVDCWGAPAPAVLENVVAVNGEKAVKHNDSTWPFRIIPLREKLMLFTRILSL